MFLYLDVKYRYIFSIGSEQIVTAKYHANDEVAWIRLEEYVIILTRSLFWLYHLLRQELKSQISSLKSRQVGEGLEIYAPFSVFRSRLEKNKSIYSANDTACSWHLTSSEEITLPTMTRNTD